MTNVQTDGTPGKARLTSESKGREFIAPYVPMPVELDFAMRVARPARRRLVRVIRFSVCTLPL